MAKKHELTEKAEQLAREIRAYSESQVHLWQLVPNLALEADGRTGFSEYFIPCIEDGFWQITTGAGHVLLSVDCATGRLAHYYASRHQQKLVDARDDDVLWLATRMDEIDAAGIIGRLSAKAQMERPSYYSETEWERAERRRVDAREKYGLGYGRPFTRSKDSPYI